MQNYQKKSQNAKSKKKGIEVEVQNTKRTVSSQLCCQICGVSNKKKSLETILDNVTPSMVLMNETQMVGRMKMSLPNYTIWVRNRSHKGGGGIATEFRQSYKDSAVGVSEGEDDDEFIITRIDAFSPALSVINSYGEQRRTRKEEVKNKWNRLRKEMEAVRMRGDFCVYAGDLNKLVGVGEFGVKGNSSEVSLGAGCSGSSWPPGTGHWTTAWAGRWSREDHLLGRTQPLGQCPVWTCGWCPGSSCPMLVIC